MSANSSASLALSCKTGLALIPDRQRKTLDCETVYCRPARLPLTGRNPGASRWNAPRESGCNKGALNPQNLVYGCIHPHGCQEFALRCPSFVTALLRIE